MPRFLSMVFGQEILRLSVTGHLTETGQAGDSICSGFEKKGGVVSINQVGEMVSADFDTGFC